MKQIEQNPVVAIAGDWFTANGRGINLGYFGKKENLEIAEKMKTVFSEWINNGHNNFEALYFDVDNFLKPIKKVRISYD